MDKCNCSPVGYKSEIQATWCNVNMGHKPNAFNSIGQREVTAQPTAGGLKFDGGKPRMELLILGCPRAMEGVADVLTFGANKYAAHSWRDVEDGINRYIAANHRHWVDIGKHGLDSRDEESGKLHIDHINTNGMFISELIRKAYGIEH